MLPKLYDEFITTKSGHARKFLGTVNHCVKCIVTEVRNGAYTLSLETTINDDCADLISSQKIIGAKANPFDDIQFFEIQKTERTIDGIIKAEAIHIKNFCFQICSNGDLAAEGTVTVLNGTPAQMWTELEKEYISTVIPFSFKSDITAKKDFSLGFDVAESLGNILGGAEGSFLDVWGGEYHWDNYNIEYLKSRGKNTDYQIRYGSNISDATQTESCESTYTHILPYGKVALEDRKINFFAPLYAIPNSECKYTKVFMLNCDSLLDHYSVGKHGYHYEETRAAMTKYAKSYALNNGLGKVKVGISVTLRSELDEMSEIGLCDTVKIQLDNFGTTATAKITEATYDTLLERWDKLLVGEPTVTVADLLLNRKRYIK